MPSKSVDRPWYLGAPPTRRARRERCGHDPVDVHETHTAVRGEARDYLVVRRWCRGCIDFIPFGPSNDTSDAVKIEIDAARMVPAASYLHRPKRTIKRRPGRAGRLAYEIMRHEVDPGRRLPDVHSRIAAADLPVLARMLGLVP